MTGEEFTDKYDHDDIKNALQGFSLAFTKKLPEFLIKDESDEQIMLDILKVHKTNVLLPVVIRSTNWLQHINRVSGINLTICLHGELWPVENRFELVGGLQEISEDIIEESLYRYLKNSVSYWKLRKEACAIFVTERVSKMAKSEKFKDLLKQVKVVELSETYKAEEVWFF